MYGEQYHVNIEVLENGFSVEVPDHEERAKKLADAKKRMKGSAEAPTPYYGDCTKKYAAKSVKEVLSLVEESLKKIPDGEFDSAFEEKAESKD